MPHIEGTFFLSALRKRGVAGWEWVRVERRLFALIMANAREVCQWLLALSLASASFVLFLCAYVGMRRKYSL